MFSSIFSQFTEVVCLFLDKIIETTMSYADHIKEPTIKLLEPVLMETVFWYNRKWVETEHYIQYMYKTNNIFHLIADLVHTSMYFVYRLFTNLWQNIVCVDNEPNEPWISSVQIHTTNNILQMTQQYTVFGFTVDDRNVYQKINDTVTPVLQCIGKLLDSLTLIFMGKYYKSFFIDESDTTMRYKMYGEKDEYDSDYECNETPDTTQEVVDHILKRAYVVSHEHFTELFNTQLQTLCIQFQELLEIMKLQGFELVYRKVNSVDCKGKLIEYINTFYTNNGVMRTSPIHQSMIIAKRYERYAIRHAYWNANFTPTKLDFTPSEVEFLVIEYHHPEMVSPIGIQLPASMMVVGNEILSFAFMYRYFKQLPKYTKYVFDHRYVLRVLDDCVNMVKIYSNQCVQLEYDSYKIVDCDMM
jgi:hypothetical protein